ncbi:MAG TPA: tyrosine-type recombinase/integrase [Gammaproteobacteria bacterium]|nr:tyrosine-type recombinase/integrase [Gammaproteobacteria bacterium]
MDLKLAYDSDADLVYRQRLEESLAAYSPALLAQDRWNRAFVLSQPQFVNEHVFVKSAIAFGGLPTLPKLELKVYWAGLLSDSRKNSHSIVERRILPMAWFRQCWSDIAQRFQVTCLAAIPCPEFTYPAPTTARGRGRQNDEFIDMFEQFAGTYALQRRQCVVDGELSESFHRSPRLTVAGDIQRSIIKQRDQYRPLHERNIIYLNDLYSDEDVRFKDGQRTRDAYLNLYHYPTWMRDAVRSHVLMKVSDGDLGPKTLVGYVRRYQYLRDFMCEKFEDPSPLCISAPLIEDDFIAWGNARSLAGKNWWTDTVAMLNTAAKVYPGLWPTLSIDRRRSRKIKKGHYALGTGRIGHNQESAGRSYSPDVINAIVQHVHELPAPIPAIFTLILGTGMRAEDGHALLFDCLRPDPDDDQFMLLTFWQNKVRRYNTKPLAKEDNVHGYLIAIIEEQRERVVRQHGKATKYLFPYFTGSQESYLDRNYTLDSLKKLCVLRDIRDEKGKVLRFSWHALRHTKGTRMAAEGHDILSIMMELGHSSPDMATVYVNNRLELRKKALMEKGSGRFFDIQGRADDKIAELLVKKDQLRATRVCGGACSMPAQIGDWCEHANACYTCKYFRADGKDLKFFQAEVGQLTQLLEDQAQEIQSYQASGRERLADITERRHRKNVEVVESLNAIILAVIDDACYRGTQSNARRCGLTDE